MADPPDDRHGDPHAPLGPVPAGLDLTGYSIQVDVEGAGGGTWHWGLGAGEAPPAEKKPDTTIVGRAPHLALVAARRLAVTRSSLPGTSSPGSTRSSAPRSCATSGPTSEGTARPLRSYPFGERNPCTFSVSDATSDLDADQRLMRSFAARDAGAATPSIAGSRADYGLGLVMLGNDAAAQDLVQDTFVKLWRSAERYDRSRGKLETWVLLMARSLAIDAIRRRVLEVRTLEHVDRPTEADQAPGPDDRAATLDLTDRARHAMSSLPPEQRAALELAYLGGKTSVEISDLEGIPVGTAKTRIRAALMRLRELLAATSSRREVGTVTTCDDVRPSSRRLPSGPRRTRRPRRSATPPRVRRLPSGTGGAPRRPRRVRFDPAAPRTAGAPRSRDCGSGRGVGRGAAETRTDPQRSSVARRGRRLAVARVRRRGLRCDPAGSRTRREGRRHELPHGPGHARRDGLQGRNTRGSDRDTGRRERRGLRVQPRPVLRRGLRPDPRALGARISPRVTERRDDLGSGSDRIRRRRRRGGLVGDGPEHRFDDGLTVSAPDGSVLATAALRYA